MKVKWSFVVFICVLHFTVAGIASAQEALEKTEEVSGDKKIVKLEEIVVTATRMETLSREVASSITVVTGDEIEKKQKVTVFEALRNVPALDVIQAGGPGRQTSILIRGAKSEHTLVLIDGVEMHDPMSPGRSFDFANLASDNIERIEIIRGPQSVLYGSDAIGGVINIITKKGKGKPGFFVSAQAGSFNTFMERVGLSGDNGLVNYSFSISRLDTEGISAASEKDGNTEKDGYENTNGSARVGFTPSDNFEWDFLLRYIDAKTDIDNYGGAGGDDPNSTSESKQVFFRTEARLSLSDGLWRQKLGFSRTTSDRDDQNGTDPAHPSDLSRGSYNGQIIKFDWQHDLFLHKANTLTLGVETEEEKGESDYYSESAFGPYASVFKEKTARTDSYYLQDQIKIRDSFFATLGVRVDDHNRFGQETTYRVTSAYLFRQTGTKIRATYGTGFKAPSLYQLFAPPTDFGPIGNENLNSETAVGWDAGFDQTLLGDRISLGVTYFNNKFKALIDYDFNLGYINISEAETSGVESYININPVDDLVIRASYTYTDTEDKSTGENLLRRAKNKYGIDANYSFIERGNINLGIIYVGERDDFDFTTVPAMRVQLDSYTLVNIASSFDVTRNFLIFGRIENLFDEEYEEVKGFGTPGVAGFLGLKLSF